MERKQWGILPLQHIYKQDVCVSRQLQSLADKLVEQWLEENPSASLEESMGFASCMMLYLRFVAVCNQNMLSDGTTRKDVESAKMDGATRKFTLAEFEERKREELKQLPTLMKELQSALKQSGKTGISKRMSVDVRTSAEAANLVFEKIRNDRGDHLETN